MTTKEQFIQSMKSRLYTEITSSILTAFVLDKEGISKLETFLEKENITQEVFTNTYKVVFAEEDLNAIMEASIKLDNLMAQGLAKSGLTSEDLNDKFNKSITKFLEDFSPELSKLCGEEEQRYLNSQSE